MSRRNDFYCVHCAKPFSLSDDSSQEQPRCPHCLRQHGVERVQQGTGSQDVQTPPISSTTHRRKWLWFSLALIGLGAIGGILFVFKLRKPTIPLGQIGALSSELLQKRLIERGVPEGDPLLRFNPFEQGAALRELVPYLKQRDPTSLTHAVVQHLAPKLASITVEITGELTYSIRTSETFAGALSKGKITKATSYELAIFMVSALRRVGLNATLAHAVTVDAPVKTADVIPSLGRYVVLVYAEPTISTKTTPVSILDPSRAARVPRWATRHTSNEMRAEGIAYDALDDISAVAHGIMLEALYESQKQEDPKSLTKAYHLAEMAANVNVNQSAVIPRLRAEVVSRLGGNNDALNYAQEALHRRDGVAERTALAKLLLTEGKAGEAASHLERAIQQDNAYWPALVLLSSIRLMVGEKEDAFKHLSIASEIAPEEPAVLHLQAMEHFLSGHTDQALTTMRRAAERAHSEMLWIELYLLLVRTGHGQEAEAIALRDNLLRQAKDPEKLKAFFDAAIAEAQGAETPSLRLPDISLKNR